MYKWKLKTSWYIEVSLFLRESGWSGLDLSSGSFNDYFVVKLRLQ